MNYDHRNIERLARSITLEIEQILDRAGIFHRTFFRCKTAESLTRKLDSENEFGVCKYNTKNKFLRDIIGIRINLYFIDDLDCLTDFFKKKFKSSFVEETIDKNNTTEFKPTRTNIIFKIPEIYHREFRELVNDKRVEDTFELQLRTVLSEGWHEVDHDLRYKCQSDWAPYPDLSRMFNGFLAALETQEWSMIHLFDRISYQHYKSENPEALLKTKLRIRFDTTTLSSELQEFMNTNRDFMKDFFKVERGKIIQVLLYSERLFPLTIDNIIYLVNHCFLRNLLITKLEPEIISDKLKEISFQ